MEHSIFSQLNARQNLCPGQKRFPITVNNWRDNQDLPPLSGGDTFLGRRGVYLPDTPKRANGLQFLIVHRLCDCVTGSLIIIFSYCSSIFCITLEIGSKTHIATNQPGKCGIISILLILYKIEYSHCNADGSNDKWYNNS